MTVGGRVLTGVCHAVRTVVEGAAVVKASPGGVVLGEGIEVAILVVVVGSSNVHADVLARATEGADGVGIVLASAWAEVFNLRIKLLGD